MLIDHNQYVFHIWCNITNKKLHPLFKSQLIKFIHLCRGDDLFNTGSVLRDKAGMVKMIAYDRLADNIDSKMRELVRNKLILDDGIHKVLIFTDTKLKFQCPCKHQTCEPKIERKFEFLKSRNIAVQIWSLEQNQYSFTADFHFPLDSFENLGEILKGEHGELVRKCQDYD